MRGQQHRRLVVVAAAGVDVRRRVVVEERRRLRADPRRRNHVAGERHAGRRIDELHRLAECVDASARNRRSAPAASASARTACWRCGRQCAGTRETVRPVPDSAESSADRRTCPGSARRCSGLRRACCPVNENGRASQRGVAEQDADAAVVERSRAAAVVAKRRQLRERRRRAVVDAAVDQKAVGGVAGPIARVAARGTRLARGRRSGRGVDRRALKAGARSGRRRRRAARGARGRLNAGDSGAVRSWAAASPR